MQEIWLLELLKCNYFIVFIVGLMSASICTGGGGGGRNGFFYELMCRLNFHIFWNFMWCRLVDSYRSFEGILTGSSTLQNIWVCRTFTDKDDGVPNQ